MGDRFVPVLSSTENTITGPSTMGMEVHYHSKQVQTCTGAGALTKPLTERFRESGDVRTHIRTDIRTYGHTKRRVELGAPAKKWKKSEKETEEGDREKEKRKIIFIRNFTNPGLEEPRPDLYIQKCDTNSFKNCSTDGIVGGLKLEKKD